MLQYWGGVLKKKFVKFVVQDLTSGGHEWMRARWSAPIRKYWKISEQMMVKYGCLCYLIDYSRGTWTPDGNNAWVKAEWKKNVKIDRIIFHGSLNTIETRTINLTIYVDGNLIGSVDKINPYGRDTIFKSDVIIECKELKIVFSSDNVELSEIEVLYGDMQLPFDTGKIREIKRNKLVDAYNEFGFRVIVLTTRLTRKMKKLAAKVLHRT